MRLLEAIIEVQPIQSAQPDLSVQFRVNLQLPQSPDISDNAPLPSFVMPEIRFPREVGWSDHSLYWKLSRRPPKGNLFQLGSLLARLT